MSEFIGSHNEILLLVFIDWRSYIMANNFKNCYELSNTFKWRNLPSLLMITFKINAGRWSQGLFIRLAILDFRCSGPRLPHLAVHPQISDPWRRVLFNKDIVLYLSLILVFCLTYPLTNIQTYRKVARIIQRIPMYFSPMLTFHCICFYLFFSVSVMFLSELFASKLQAWCPFTSN